VRTEQIEKLDDIDGAFQRLSEGKIQSIIVPPNGLLTFGRERIVELFLTVPPALLSAQAWRSSEQLCWRSRNIMTKRHPSTLMTQ
jgi:hypothetical protein